MAAAAAQVGQPTSANAVKSDPASGSTNVSGADIASATSNTRTPGSSSAGGTDIASGLSMGASQQGQTLQALSEQSHQQGGAQQGSLQQPQGPLQKNLAGLTLQGSSGVVPGFGRPRGQGNGTRIPGASGGNMGGSQ